MAGNELAGSDLAAVDAARVESRDAEAGDESGYDPRAFSILRDMQERHFWYQGRHRFILCALRRQLKQVFPGRHDLSAVDLGGGCGGWVKYLRRHAPGMFGELALADPSPTARRMAREVLGDDASILCADARDLQWRERWDVIFLLDVLEHIEDDEHVLRQVHRALRPGGVAIITAPALQCLWSYNDELEGHVRRYSRSDVALLTQRAGFRLRLSRYFMFFLSPVLVGSRMIPPSFDTMADDAVMSLRRRTHRTPCAPLNAALELIFACEPLIGLRLPFPWGTSLFTVIQKSNSK